MDSVHFWVIEGQVLCSAGEEPEWRSGQGEATPSKCGRESAKRLACGSPDSSAEMLEAQREFWLPLLYSSGVAHTELMTHTFFRRHDAYTDDWACKLAGWKPWGQSVEMPSGHLNSNDGHAEDAFKDQWLLLCIFTKQLWQIQRICTSHSQTAPSHKVKREVTDSEWFKATRSNQMKQQDEMKIETKSYSASH